MLFKDGTEILCMHEMNTLQALRGKYGNELAVTHLIKIFTLQSVGDFQRSYCEKMYPVGVEDLQFARCSSMEK